MNNGYIIHNGELYNSDELFHHGVKGQRWGVRRFQKKDGSLTAAGKKRYDSILKDVEKKKAAYKDSVKKGRQDVSSKKAAYKAAVKKASEAETAKKAEEKEAVKKAKEQEAVAKAKAKEAAKKAEERAAAKKAAEEAAIEKEKYEAEKQQVLKTGTAQDILKYKGDLTQQEMQSAISRIRWESDMRDLSARETATGKNKADKIFENVDKVTGYVNTGAKAWNTFANVYNAFSGTDKISLPKIDTNITSGNKETRKKEKKEAAKEAEAKKKRAEQEAERESKREERAKKKEDTVHEGVVIDGPSDKSSTSKTKSSRPINVKYYEVYDTPVSDIKKSTSLELGKSYTESILALPAPKKDKDE